MTFISSNKKSLKSENERRVSYKTDALLYVNVLVVLLSVKSFWVEKLFFVLSRMIYKILYIHKLIAYVGSYFWWHFVNVFLLSLLGARLRLVVVFPRIINHLANSHTRETARVERENMITRIVLCCDWWRYRIHAQRLFYINCFQRYWYFGGIDEEGGLKSGFIFHL